MTCADHQRTINRFIDHEAKATECGEMFEHLGTCTECRRFLDTILTLGAELEKVEFMDDPSDQVVHTRPTSGRQPVIHTVSYRTIHLRASTITLVLFAVFLFGLIFSAKVELVPPTDSRPISSVTP